VASAVDPDNAVTVLDEEKHLRVPIVGTQGPAAMENDGLAMAPILIEDLDAILRRDCAHNLGSFSVVVGKSYQIGREPC
jgi:hypothetical protein